MVERSSSETVENGPIEPKTSVDCAVTQPSNAAIIDISTLIVDHHAAMYRYAYRLSGNQSDAEDLTQQAFLIGHQKLHQLRDPSKVRGWLYTILRTCFLKSCRKKQPVAAGAIELEVDDIPQIEKKDDNFDVEQLQLALNELPEEFRLVLAMYYFEECSYREIAAKLELPIGTVMSRLSRAKSRLRGALLTTESKAASS